MRCFYAVDCPELVSKFAKKTSRFGVVSSSFIDAETKKREKVTKKKTYEVLTPRKFYTLKMRTILSI
jgi:hypothetical protein